jgi:hypothetical protein
MVKLLDFLREYINIRRESKSYCKSCETYKEQLAVVNYEKKLLLDKFVLVSPSVPQAPDVRPDPIIPQIVPWRIQREMMQKEDHARAMTLRRQEEDEQKAKKLAAENREKQGPIEDKGISIDALEKELSIGEK